MRKSRRYQERGKGRKGEEGRRWRGRRRARASECFLRPFGLPVYQELVELCGPQSRQEELVDKYLWVGADICKHS